VRWCGVMVARNVVVFCKEFHTGPFQSGFDSQHRHDFLSWIEDVDGSTPLSLLLSPPSLI
jgi:hypothetical protein